MHRFPLFLALVLPLDAGSESAYLETEPQAPKGLRLPDLLGGIQSLDMESEALLSSDIDVNYLVACRRAQAADA